MISHGSHTLQDKDSAGEIASQCMANGLTYTNQKKIRILSQSLYCDDFLDSLNISYQKIDRLFHPNQSYKKNSTLKNENPNYVEARVALGILYFGNGSVIEAQAEWQKCISIKGDCKEAKMYLELSKSANEVVV